MGYELQRDGWLGKLRTRNAWEFLPGARGGAYGSGNRFIEFRARHAVDLDWGGVLAMESADSVLGLAERIPEQEVVALVGACPARRATASGVPAARAWEPRGRGLAFKGGTVLRKFRAGNVGRFSTDLDFAAPGEELTCSK